MPLSAGRAVLSPTLPYAWLLQQITREISYDEASDYSLILNGRDYLVFSIPINHNISPQEIKYRIRVHAAVKFTYSRKD